MRDAKLNQKGRVGLGVLDRACVATAVDSMIFIRGRLGSAIISYINKEHERSRVLQIHQNPGIGLQITDNKPTRETPRAFHLPPAISRASPDAREG